MNAWQYLLSRSSILIGTAWEHITSPLRPTGLVVNDGIAVEVDQMAVEATVEDVALVASVELSPVEAQVEDNPIIAEVEEW